jgi:hypothetical protein
MKQFLIAVLLILTAQIGFAQTGPFKVTWKFMNIVEGYDHTCKTQVWIDGKMAGESGEFSESQGGTFSVNVPAGSHEVRVVNLALYEGSWEEHTIANEYSIDCLWEGQHTFNGKDKLFLLFDIDSGTLAGWKKMPKVKKKK